MPRKSLKESILDAAERVISRQGLAATTVEAIATEAGVSKGGLFYHFANKKELLLRMLDRYEGRFRKLRDQLLADLPDSPTRILKATVLASLDHPARRAAKLFNLFSLLDDADLREKIFNFKNAIFKEATASSKHPEKAALALLVADGMWLAEMFDRQASAPAFRNKVVRELMSAIDRLEKGEG